MPFGLTMNPLAIPSGAMNLGSSPYQPAPRLGSAYGTAADQFFRRRPQPNMGSLFAGGGLNGNQGWLGDIGSLFGGGTQGLFGALSGGGAPQFNNTPRPYPTQQPSNPYQPNWSGGMGNWGGNLAGLFNYNGGGRGMRPPAQGWPQLPNRPPAPIGGSFGWPGRDMWGGAGSMQNVPGSRWINPQF